MRVSWASQSKLVKCAEISVDLIAFNTSITLLVCCAYISISLSTHTNTLTWSRAGEEPYGCTLKTVVNADWVSPRWRNCRTCCEVDCTAAARSASDRGFSGTSSFGGIACSSSYWSTLMRRQLEVMVGEGCAWWWRWRWRWGAGWCVPWRSREVAEGVERFQFQHVRWDDDTRYVCIGVEWIN